ncbi:hypothetical protein DPMN_188142 [Dreissena polymorpha]|uniref:Uncharacterized protein n=1 Tax=Dreissena polymorpha TaxID=45954 RepID=A0A9D4I9R2_DREPO|nr:hypothetical protein DPMN_188142 [Dreissena polymorpha]
MRERESTMTRMRQYDDNSATIRWRECEHAMARMRERDSTMTTMRQCDGDSEIVRLQKPANFICIRDFAVTLPQKSCKVATSSCKVVAAKFLQSCHMVNFL